MEDDKKLSKDFSEDDKIKILLWCDRHCCLCRKQCDTNIVIHHIEKDTEIAPEKLHDIDNAIPLCLECHGRIDRYNPRHTVGTKYKVKEIKSRRNQIYDEYTRHLVPPLDFRVTQQIGVGAQQPSPLPRVGFNITHAGDSLPARFKVEIEVFLGGRSLGLIKNPRKPYYSGDTVWYLNPRHTLFGNFHVPRKCADSPDDLQLEVRVTVIDQYDREHVLLPLCYTYVRDGSYWFAEPTSFEQLTHFREHPEH